MLIAVDQSAHLTNALQAKRQTDYFCPGCMAPVTLKRGTVTIAHFAHCPGRACTTFSEGETAEHLLGKRQLATWFENSGYQVQLEAPLAQLHQRPDILVQAPHQAPLAIEFQCSPLSNQRLWERTAGYRQHGYRVLWLLGRPYHKGVRTHGKALKFLQNSSNWGYFVLLWDVQTNTGTLNYHLMSLDCEPLMHQVLRLDPTQVIVNQVLAMQPPLRAVSTIAYHFQHYQRNLLMGRLRQQGYQRDLQNFCYQHGGTLQLLPDWVVPMVAKPPLLSVPYLVWYLHLFITLRAQSEWIADAQLHDLCWQTLRPLLARNACIRHRGMVNTTLITDVINELTAQQVLVATATGWQLNLAQLRWKKR
ncbi:competence protein CoiA [Lactiplantibacillus xiangfangensis]|uniref:competence protein CoiA n=1 Tax=Lactiplantibacillus xiangfangensis TaxID=942150 RepID=UPI00384E261C